MPTMLQMLADANSVGSVMQSYVTPAIRVVCILASLVCVLILVNGGIQYTTSTGRPERLESAKTIIRNALVGLVIVLAAVTLTTILSHAYGHTNTMAATKLPALNDIKPDDNGNPLVGVMLRAITGVLNDLMQTAAIPFLKSLTYFTSGTPLIADNSGVFNLWLAVVGMTDALFVLVVALLGFHVMGAATFGLEEIEFKHLLPRFGLTFLLINSSAFLIDGIISLSNAMIHALQAGFSHTSVWDVLTAVVKQASGMSFAALLIMLAFLILTVVLLVYYVGRIVTIYIGAVLAPLVLLVWLIPGFRDFTETAIKTYLTTIFVLFVHVVILALAATLFTGMSLDAANHMPDPLMSIIVGLATLVALLKTQGVMLQLSYANLGPRSFRRLGGQLMNGISYVNSKRSVDSASTGDRRPLSRPTYAHKRIGSMGASAVNRQAKPKDLTGAQESSKHIQGKTRTTTITPNTAEPSNPETKEKP